MILSLEHYPEFLGITTNRKTLHQISKFKMATGSSSQDSEQVDRITLLYPKVEESEAPLPRSWSSKDKFSFIGLSQNNLRVHYKGKKVNGANFFLNAESVVTAVVKFFLKNRFDVYLEKAIKCC